MSGESCLKVEITPSPLKILPYTYEVAQLAGQIAIDLDQPIELADAAIVATTILNGASPQTINRKYFIDIKNLQLFNKFL